MMAPMMAVGAMNPLMNMLPMLGGGLLGSLLGGGGQQKPQQRQIAAPMATGINELWGRGAGNPGMMNMMPMQQAPAQQMPLNLSSILNVGKQYGLGDRVNQVTGLFGAQVPSGISDILNGMRISYSNPRAGYGVSVGNPQAGMNNAMMQLLMSQLGQ